MSALYVLDSLWQFIIKTFLILSCLKNVYSNLQMNINVQLF